MSNSRLKTKLRKEHNHTNAIPFDRKDGQPAYVHDVKAFLKHNARERDDRTVVISDPNSDVGLCSRCDELAPIEYAYTVPFRDEPQISSRVYLRFCPECWLKHVEKEFLPRIENTTGEGQ